MIAYWVHNLDPFAVQFGGGFGVRWYGLAYLAAFAAAYFVYVSLARRGFSVIPADKVGDFITGCAVFGVLIGGRLGEMLFYNFSGFLQDPLVFFRVWEGGMSAHGGILGVMLYTLWYAWRHDVNWPGLGDNLVVGVPLGLFFGRLANFINGELFGHPSEVAWAVKFPKEIYQAPVEAQRAVLARAQEMFAGPVGLDEVLSAVPGSAELTAMVGGFLTPRHPSQIYEALLEECGGDFPGSGCGVCGGVDQGAISVGVCVAHRGGLFGGGLAAAGLSGGLGWARVILENAEGAERRRIGGWINFTRPGGCVAD